MSTRILKEIQTEVESLHQFFVGWFSGELPADAFKVLLWPERAAKGAWPQNWKQRVEGALSALQALTFAYQT